MTREFYLSPRGRGGVSCDADGAFVGAIPILKRLQKDGREAWHLRDCEELSEELYTQYGLPIDISSKTGGLTAIANALNDGDVARAQIATILLAIPDPPQLSKKDRSHDRMIKIIRDLHWSGMLKWDPDKHPRWPAGSDDGIGGQFAPTGEGGDANGSPSSQPDATQSHSSEQYTPNQSAHTQLADAGVSDAFDDPMAEAARAAARSNTGAYPQVKYGDSEYGDFWQAAGSRLSHEIKTALSEIGRAEIAENNANIAAAAGGANAIARVLRAYANYRAEPWLDDRGHPVEIPAVDVGYPVAGQAELMARLTAREPLTRPATNADWIDPLIGLASTAAITASPVARFTGLGVEALDATDGSVLIGNSGFRSIGEFTDAVTMNYQKLYDRHYADTMDLASLGFVENNPLVIGGRTDTLTRAGLRDWLENIEAINEGPGQIIQVNRRLYDPLGSGRFRIPDVYIPESRTILDGSLQFKTSSMSQITDFRAFSGGANVVLIRPASAFSSRVAGSYGIVH